MKKKTFLFLAAAIVLLTVSCNEAILERTALKTAEDYQVREMEYLNNGDYDSAIAEFTQAIRLDPNDAEAYWKRHNAYRNRGNAYYDRYEVYHDERDWDSATADWDQSSADRNWYMYIWVISRNPNDAEAYYRRGLAYYDKKDYDQAIADFTHIISLDPNDAKAYYWRGLAYYNKKDYDQAIADYTQAIKLNPNNVEAYTNRAIADFNQAIAALTWEIGLDPYNAFIYYNRGLAYSKKGDYDQAIADYTQAIKLNPNYVEARGIMYSNKGDNKKSYKLNICSVHNIPMSKGRLRIMYGYAPPAFRAISGWDYFPNSDNGPWGGCEVSHDSPQYIEGYFCEACNTERDIYSNELRRRNGLYPHD